MLPWIPGRNPPSPMIKRTIPDTAQSASSDAPTGGRTPTGNESMNTRGASENVSRVQPGKPVSAPMSDRVLLSTIAHRAMIERGLEPDFPPAELNELAAIHRPAESEAGMRDLRTLTWASIDNDDSLDLDQITVAIPMDDGRVRILIAVADVDVLVPRGSAIDEHAAHNTTSVYTPSQVFPMLPTVLSTGLTSLNEGQDRVALVVDIVFAADGSISSSEHYRSVVRNHAKLAYRSVGDWLAGEAAAPDRISAAPALAANLRLQDSIAQKAAGLRQRHGALGLETIEPKAVFRGDAMIELEPNWKNRATQLIEEFMIAANQRTADFLSAKESPSIRRVLRPPQKWDRIVALALESGEQLPETPDAVALEGFLERRRKASPDQFADLSLAVVKLIGRAEYAVDLPGAEPPGHFALAIRDYSHSTAPNRRYPDLLTQRLLKAALLGVPSPYTDAELTELARRCTEGELDAIKVERRMRKSAAALLLSKRNGESFDGVVTGASDKGTWVRLVQPPAEGRLTLGYLGLKVGDLVHVKLIHTDVERGFIDFIAINNGAVPCSPMPLGKKVSPMIP